MEKNISEILSILSHIFQYKIHEHTKIDIFVHILEYYRIFN